MKVNKFLASLSVLLLAGMVQVNASSRRAMPVAQPSAGLMQKRAAELLQGLAAGFCSMPAYAVTFEIAAGDTVVRGSYAVAGTDYYLTLGDAEVFADGTTRYEVDNRRREVTVVEVDTASRNVLDNPVRAFDFLGSEYAAELLDEHDGKARIRLTPARNAASADNEAKERASAAKPRPADAGMGSITVTVSTSPVRPERLAYDYDGERIVVDVTGIAPLRVPLKTFERANYSDFEFIDFR